MAGMFYSLQEAAERLGKTQDELRGIVNAGKLREFRDGPNLLFKVEEVEALMSEAGVMGVQEAPELQAPPPQPPLPEVMRGTNIRVHVLCPGGVATDMVARVRPDIAKDELIGPEELAELVHYLVTHKGNAVVDELHIRRATSTPWF